MKRERAPVTYKIAHLHGQALEQLHQADDLRRAGDALWEQGRQTAQQQMRRAKRLRSAGQPEDAVRMLRAAVGSFPSAAAHLALAEVLLEVGEAEEACEQYRLAVQIDPQLSHQYLELGAALEQAGLLGTMLSPFREALDPARIETLRASAVLDPIEAFLQQKPERDRWRYRDELENFLGDLRPASLWGTLSVPPAEIIGWLMNLDPWEIRESTCTDFLRFCRELGYLPDDPELNEWLEEDEAVPADSNGRSEIAAPDDRQPGETSNEC